MKTMKSMFKSRVSIISMLCIGFVAMTSLSLQAGNEDRIGSAGGTQLLINPWSRSSALGNSNIASVVGIEGSFLNVAGIAFTRKTEVMFSNTDWMSGSDVSVNTLGLTQRVSESGVLGINVVTIDFGELRRTTVDLPDGDGSTFTANNLSFGLSYAKEFSNSIYGGLGVKVISESISNAKASGVVFDAGIKYVTGEQDHIKFGIALRNVGPPIEFSGGGLSFQNTIDNGEIFDATAEQRSAQYELPSLIQIGGSYDFNLNENHKLTTSASFTSNAFSQDQFAGGLEYSFKKYFVARGGYIYEPELEEGGGVNGGPFLTGPTAGLSIQAPIGKDGGTLGFDYAYRASNPFDGVHTIGVRVDL